jgi:hypothetical protein
MYTYTPRHYKMNPKRKLTCYFFEAEADPSGEQERGTEKEKREHK